MISELSGEFRPKPSYDVCVIGGGAAGITIATKARALGLSVFLAEGGGEEISDASQACYRGAVVGDEYFDLEIARLRFFGGTTNHWGGMCRPLEADDFNGKSAAPQAHWPITIDELSRYLSEASDILQIPAIPADRTLNSPATLRRVHFVFSPPVRFGQKFRPIFASDEQIDVCLNCNAIDVTYDGRTIRNARFRNFSDLEIDVHAKTYVLACGGIENSRLLLHWNNRLNNALGNRKDNVGRYWMEHPTQTIGELVSCGTFGMADDDASLPFSRQRLYLAPTRNFAEDRKILNCGLHIYRERQGLIGAALTAAACHAPDWIARAIAGGRSNFLTTSWVRASSEQEPTRENRVVLAREKDAFGIPRSELHWRRSALDKKTIKTVALEAGAYFAQSNLGRLKLHDWLIADDSAFRCEDGGHCPGGFHHMGGTRMAASEAAGVVDANCRVFGTENLFVAGSSVFPAAGFCNPTLSIVQLSLRLADHLRTLV